MNPHAEMINRLRDYCDGGNPDKDSDLVEDAITALEAEGEPVAYIRRDQLQKAQQAAFLCDVSPEPRSDRVAIFTRPAPLVPMTKDEAADIWNLWETGKASGHEIILAVEAHHGVKP